MTIRQIATIFILTLLFLSAEGYSVITIGVVKDSYSPSLEKVDALMRKEIHELLTGEFEVKYSEKAELIGDWSREGVMRAVKSAMEDPDIDIVIGVGTLASNELCHIDAYPKPVFAPFIMNIEMQQLPFENGVSGVKNLNYLSFPSNLNRDVDTFNQIAPFTHLSFIVNGYVYNAIPEMEDTIRMMLDDADIRLDVVPVWDSADDALNRIPAQADAVYIVSLTQLEDLELEKLINGFIARDLPSFSMFRQRYIQKGVLASMSPDTDMPRLIRRLALNIQRVLLGEDAGDLSVFVSESEQLVMNMKTAEMLGVSPPWYLLNEAELLYAGEKLSCKMMNIRDAVDFALVRNPGLAASGKNIDIGSQQVSKARSRLYPQLRVSGAFTQIDEDRAENSFGIFPERAVWGHAGLSQVIYNNQAIGKLRTEQQLQQARCYGYQIDKLDLIQRVAESYLNLMRAQTVERIQRKNLERTRAHLKLARQRVNVGVARSSEVYRWESQYSSDLTQVTHASFRTKAAETNLKQLINIPAETCLKLAEVNVDDPYWSTKKDWLQSHVTNDRSLEAFIEFSVIEALYRSDKIKKIRSEICAQSEILGVTQRAFWAPDVSVNILATQRADEWGAGSTGPALFNRSDWLVGLNLSFPLYTGGYKTAAKRQACAELKQLKLILENEVNIEKEKVRIAAYNAISSHSAIGLSKQSAETAQSNLSLVQDSYSKGVVQIVDLLDAQNQALVADLVTANAEYDFLSDLVYFQRQVHQFDFLADPQNADDWVRDINGFFQVRFREDQ